MLNRSVTNPSSWKDLIIHQDDKSVLAPDGARANLHFARPRSINDCVEAALVAPEVAFFIKTAASPNPVIVFGAIECRCTDASTVSISKQHGIHHGMGNPASKFKIDPANFFELFPESDPLDFDTIAADLSSVSFNSAITDTNGHKVTDLRSAMFIPPIVANKVFELQSFTSGEMACHIMHLLRVETLADTDIDENAQSSFAIAEEYHSLITWLYYFQQMNEVTLQPIFEGSNLAVASKDLHSRVFGPVTDPMAQTSAQTNLGPAPSHIVNQMASQSALQGEQNEYLKLIAGSMERSSTNRRGFDRLPKSVKNMILAAITKDGSTPVTDISPEGQEIFDARTDADAHIALKHAMDSAGLYYGEFSPAQAKFISSGNWQWSGINPSGMSMLLFNPYDPLSTVSLEKAQMVLHLKTKFGMDSISLEKLTETDVILPTDAEGAIQRITITKFLFNLFGDDCLIARNLEYLIEMIRQNMQLFQQMVAERGTFIAEFLCAIDSRVNCWFQQCNRHPHNLAAIDRTIIDFYDIIASIVRRNFTFTPLPPGIITIVQNHGLADGFNDLNPKSREKAKTDRGGTVDNPNQRQEWMLRAGKVYANLIGRPEDVHLRPKGVCLRWHIKGYCFAGCKHPHGEPTAAQAGQICTFIKKMRDRIANTTGATAA